MTKIFSYVFEWHDWSAKTPVIKLVSEKINNLWINTITCAPFSIANESLKIKWVSDIYNLWIDWEESTTKAQEIILNIINQYLETFQNNLWNNNWVILFDRWWMTVLRWMQDCPFIDLKLKETLFAKWTENILPTFFFETKPEITKQRSRFSRNVPWTKTDKLMREDYDKRMEFYNLYKDNFLWYYEINKVRVDLNPIANDIFSKILKNFN